MKVTMLAVYLCVTLSLLSPSMGWFFGDDDDEEVIPCMCEFGARSGQSGVALRKFGGAEAVVHQVGEVTLLEPSPASGSGPCKVKLEAYVKKGKEGHYVSYAVFSYGQHPANSDEYFRQIKFGNANVMVSGYQLSSTVIDMSSGSYHYNDGVIQFDLEQDGRDILLSSDSCPFELLYSKNHPFDDLLISAFPGAQSANAGHPRLCGFCLVSEDDRSLWDKFVDGVHDFFTRRKRK